MNHEPPASTSSAAGRRAVRVSPHEHAAEHESNADGQVRDDVARREPSRPPEEFHEPVDREVDLRQEASYRRRRQAVTEDRGVVARRQHHCRAGVQRRPVTRDSEAIAVGQPDVEKDQLRLEGPLAWRTASAAPVASPTTTKSREDSSSRAARRKSGWSSTISSDQAMGRSSSRSPLRTLMLPRIVDMLRLARLAEYQ